MLNHIEPAVHGALDFAELERAGIHPDDVLDFSVNSNPFSPSPKVVEAVHRTPLERYPDRESISLRRALAQRLDVSPEQIVVGNGTSELIQMVAFTFLVHCKLCGQNEKENVLIAAPTFGEYSRAVDLMGANIYYWKAVPETGFAFCPEEIEKILKRQNIRMVFLCTPNNPTGQVFPVDVLGLWADQYPDTLFVVDEAYIAFVSGLKSALTLRRRNIITLRSMTKDYAIAGLRLGYAVADEAMIHALSSIRPAWNVNALAQAAGLAALQDEEYLHATLVQLWDEKQNLLAGLKSLGFAPVPSWTNYFLAPVGNGRAFRQRLLAHGILVRDCASFGLPEYVRIATRLHAENLRLLTLLEKEFV